MNIQGFEDLIARLEVQSAAHPRAYQVKVGLLALLGFGVLLMVLGFAGAGLLALAGVAAALLFSGGKALILVLKLGKLLILLAIPLWLLIKSSVQALFVRLPKPEGHELQRRDAPALFAAMADMRRRMKGPRFHHVLLTEEMNAAVMQRPAFGLFGWPRNYLLLGLPLLEALTPDEARAVVAHEYGHLAGSHGRFGAYIYRLRNTWGTIQDIAQQWQGWLGKPLQKLVGWYAPYFNAYTFVLARANEYQADRASADLVGADVAAHALKRVNLSAPRYSAFLDDTIAQMRESAEPPRDLSQRWAAAADTAPALDQARTWLDRALQRQPAPDDTHPGLAERLRALAGRQSPGELPPLERGTSAAEAWLGRGLPALRQALAQAWRDRVAEPWRAGHQRYEQQRQALRELEQLEAPDRAQQLQRIVLRQDLEPTFDALAALTAFNAQFADDPAGLFHEGTTRLKADDDQGLALLDRAMTLDPEATLPACEQACNYLHARNDPRLKAYVERWQQRQSFEASRQMQANVFDPQHELRTHELPEAEVQRCRELLRAQGQHLAEAYLARRVLPSDASVTTHVIGLQLKLWSRLRGKGPAVVDALVRQEWPMHAHFIVLEKNFKPLRRRLLSVARSRVL